MAAQVRIRTGALERIGNAQGLRSRYARAKHLGVAQSTVGRVLDGEQLPGNSLIAATLSKLHVSFEDVFEVDGTDNGAAA
ncbi:hypothetical protein [Lentzea flava]|uniref:DNA-binding transcriptional regulator, XRE-family HTH domain n=1 Tax=Lentzea flava TaxID=103732 RepID=A0ABQ2V990_9PSEU|nr:hypothetical protein [Lentzea flava]MCP2203996.1 Bacteriophage CI repressor helix-turn-helix domain-containing protein [Lentzea flava]GGU73473.1 hypothetical protein GCM10010178_76300 [Lentzea flava]